MTLTKKKNTKKTRRKRPHYTRNNPNKRKRTVRRKSNSRKNKKRKIKNQDGGAPPLFFMLFLFYVVYSNILSSTIRTDTGGPVDVENINVGEMVDLIPPENVGISLVPYNKHHYEVFMEFCLKTEAMVVDIDELEKITSVNYYNNPYQDRGVDDVIYSQRYLRDNSALTEYRKRWMEPEIRDYSYLSEGNLNVIYNALLPGIKLLTSGNVPRKMFITGASSSVSQGPLSDTNWHQDYNPGALYYSPQSTNRDLRVILIPQSRHGFKDTTLTMFSKKLGNIKPLSQTGLYSGKNAVDPLLEPSMINIKMDNQDDYLAIMFDNYKVFHKTPTLSINEWLNLEEDRQVYQIQIKWDDKDAYTSIEPPSILSELNKYAVKSIDERLSITDPSDEILSELSELSL